MTDVTPIRKFSIWQHKGNLKLYQVLGFTFNTITDCVEVKYRPLYVDQHLNEHITEYTRQIGNHEKSFQERFDFIANVEVEIVIK